MSIQMSSRVLPIPKHYSYISTHIAFITVEELLRLPISLHCISLEQRKAYFVEMSDGSNPYNTRRFSIQFVSQRELGKYLYALPLDQFYQYVEGLDLSQRRVVWLFHSARCGSTVWAQVFNELPNWGVVSECNFLLHSLMYENNSEPINNFLHSETFARATLAGFKFNVSRFPESYSIFVKGATFQDLSLLHPVAKYFKNLKLLFSYRNCLPSTESWSQAFAKYKLMFLESSRRIVNGKYTNDYISLFIVGAHTQWWLHPARSRVIPNPVPVSQFEWYVVYWCSMVCGVRRAQEQGYGVHCIKYEDMQADCEGLIRRVFNHLGIDESLVAMALQSTRQDSHADTYFSHRKRKDRVNSETLTESLSRANKILEYYDCLSLNSDLVMPSTLWLNLL